MPVQKSVTYSWGEEPGEGGTVLVIETAGDPYRIEVPADADDFAKAATVVSVQNSLGKPKA